MADQPQQMMDPTQALREIDAVCGAYTGYGINGPAVIRAALTSIADLIERDKATAAANAKLAKVNATDPEPEEN